MKSLSLAFLISSVALLSLNSCSSQYSTPSSSDKKSITDLHSLMYEMLTVISDLQMYMVSEKAFSDSANQTKIGTQLDALTSLSQQVIHQKSLQVPTYKISGRVLDEHIQETARVFKAGNKKYARWMLYSTPAACISCHTQGGESAKPLWMLKADQVSGTDFERAEFLFATRNYEEALKLYNLAISRYPSNSSVFGILELETALKRKLSYYLRVQRNYQAAYDSVKSDLKNSKLPKALRGAMKSWQTELQGKLRAGHSDKKLSPKALLSQAEKTFGNSGRLLLSAESRELVDFLILAGRLAEALKTEDKSDLTPEYLYWLGFAELSLNHQFFFSLGPLYLKECIRDYSSHPIAKSCYRELEGEMHSLYSGSRGLDMPSDVAEELEELKRRVGL
jgi:tetratricopeptide (TPR) repeat protein